MTAKLLGTLHLIPRETSAPTALKQ